ncbi:unnamed protein product [Echinostoma caproni]|uniref:Uncharacterized protein n=1 Tax=Echinostoma caproni TaxID=27848 RepID=A0A183AG31_9TREM|nr:unnamed protein product [Echinostoma caproni]
MTKNVLITCRNLGLTDHSSNVGSTRSPDYLSNAAGSSNLLSRLDGLNACSGAGVAASGGGPGSRIGNGTGIGVGDSRKKGLARSLSTASSSSSSSSSSPLSPPSLINSPARMVDSTRSSSRLSNMGRTKRNGLGDTTAGSELDSQIASFWGSTFADLLNGSSGAGEEEMTMSRTSSRDLNANLASTTLRPTLSSALVSKWSLVSRRFVRLSSGALTTHF